MKLRVGFLLPGVAQNRLAHVVTHVLDDELHGVHEGSLGDEALGLLLLEHEDRHEHQSKGNAHPEDVVGEPHGGVTGNGVSHKAIEQLIHFLRQLIKRIHYRSFPSARDDAVASRQALTDSIPQNARNATATAHPKASVASRLTRYTTNTATDSIVNETAMAIRPRAMLASCVVPRLRATSNKKAVGAHPTNPQTAPTIMCSAMSKETLLRAFLTGERSLVVLFPKVHNPRGHFAYPVPVSKIISNV